jgi:hypothetical protein
VFNPYGSGSSPMQDGGPSVAPPIEDYAQPYPSRQNGGLIPSVPSQRPVTRPDSAPGHWNPRNLILAQVLSSILLIAVIPIFFWLADRKAEGRAPNGAPIYEVEAKPEENPPKFASVAVGERFDLGDYTLSVDEVTLDADELIASADQRNEPPAGRYVLVDLTAEYSGYGEGDPFLDLDYEFSGSDARQYPSSDCRAHLPIDRFALPEPEGSGALQFQVCVDVPPKAIDGGRFFVKSWYVEEDVQGVYVTLN